MTLFATRSELRRRKDDTLVPRVVVLRAQGMAAPEIAVLLRVPLPRVRRVLSWPEVKERAAAIAAVATEEAMWTLAARAGAAAKALCDIASGEVRLASGEVPHARIRLAAACEILDRIGLAPYRDVGTPGR